MEAGIQRKGKRTGCPTKAFGHDRKKGRVVIPAELVPAGSKQGAGIQRIQMKIFCVYILCNKRNGTLYTGVTSDLIKRVYEHKNNLVDGFTKKYGVHRLVWYETHESAETAIIREKQIKKWKRAWKLELILKN